MAGGGRAERLSATDQPGIAKQGPRVPKEEQGNLSVEKERRRSGPLERRSHQGPSGGEHGGSRCIACALVQMGRAVGFVSYRHRGAERFFEGVPVILVRHGKAQEKALAREQITRSELMEAIRREGHTSVANIRFAVLENDGSITVGAKREK